MRAAWGLLVVIGLAGCVQGPAQDESDDPEDPAEPDPGLMAHLGTLAAFPELRFETEYGTIRMILYADWTPQTVAHIGGLAEDGFYDGTTIHRVIDDFVIQGGDPTGTGEGGSGPGGLSTNTVPLEIHEGLQFGSGAVGLARWTDDTGDSQWFITEKPALHLNDPQGQPNEALGPYSLFGQVFEGMEVVRSVAAVETLPNDRPIEDVLLSDAELLEPPGADLFNLIVDVVEPFDAWYVRDAALEVPRHAIAGHPMLIRLHAVPDGGAQGPGGCDGRAADANAMWHEASGTRVEVAFEATADPCTFEVVFTPSVAGTWTFLGHDAPREGVPHQWDFEVLPWHDAYHPFTAATDRVTNPA